MGDSGNVGTLVRSKLWFDQGFTQVPNLWVRDSKLTYGARGVLVWLLSHDAGFEVTILGIAANTSHGVDAVRAMVGELERAGYLKRYRRRDKGRIVGTTWHLFDPHAPIQAVQLDITPEAPLSKRKARSEPQRDLPALAKPALAKPTLAKPTTKEDQLKEDLTQVLESATDAREAVVLPECRHDKIPGDGRCVLACRADYLAHSA